MHPFMYLHGVQWQCWQESQAVPSSLLATLLHTGTGSGEGGRLEEGVLKVT